MVVDQNCYCCKMIGDESEAGLGIYFCHFDGCNMENEFAFSSFATMEEWKAEQRRYEEWSRKSESERKRKREEASDTLMNIDDCEIPSDSVWLEQIPEPTSEPDFKVAHRRP
ncbi:MAG: hypothetical protein C5B55_12775 [Blastocatellia bacterium]|nr:MAG: hypothetical protein C5B55_12775 [Blastocatellia bacterium]